jgi:hypothetical protein
LKHLAALKSLRYLSVDNTHITDAAAETLKAFSALTRLNVYHTLITAKGHAELKAALPQCAITWDAGSSLPNRRRS